MALGEPGLQAGPPGRAPGGVCRVCRADGGGTNRSAAAGRGGNNAAVSKGVEASRVFVEGKDEAQPVADNKTAEGHTKNRRVTVEVVGTRTVTK